MSSVSERGDELRRTITPNAILRHQYYASSTFEAFQMNNDWQGWGTWNPADSVPNQQFTEADVLEQQRYLIKRQTI